LLHELAADRAADSVLVVKLVDAVSAQSVTTVDQDARNTLTHVVLLSAELANVQSSRLIVQVHDARVHLSSHDY